MVFAILTGRQSGQKLQCLYGNPMANNFSNDLDPKLSLFFFLVIEKLTLSFSSLTRAWEGGCAINCQKRTFGNQASLHNECEGTNL